MNDPINQRLPFMVDLAEHPDMPVLKDVAGGDTLLTALEDFAEVGWEYSDASLLKQVLWVRDSQDRPVAVGHYRILPGYPYPVICIYCAGGSDGLPVRDTTYRFYRSGNSGHYRYNILMNRVNGIGWEPLPT
jgi:hypothetical protein